jgi:hypothetical protein
MKKEENLKIVEPLSEYMQYQGWVVEKTHGNRFQSGFPDLFCCHSQHYIRWIECKVIRNHNIHFEQSQIIKFSKWISHGVKIWIIAGIDFRGINNKMQLHAAYTRLFKDPNALYMLNPETRRLLI